jgi:uroporphyrinogen decarboxylase
VRLLYVDFQADSLDSAKRKINLLSQVLNYNSRTMEKLTPRARFNCIMNHQVADRVPLDLAGTSLTAIDSKVAAALKTELAISGEDPGEYRAFDERILQALDIDFRRVGRLIASGDRPLAGRPGYQVDMWGVVRAWTGRYWDIVTSPLKGASLDDLEGFPWPDPAAVIDESELDSFRTEARRLWEKTDFVVVAEHPVYGVFELACWMCGFEDFLWRLAADKPFVHALFKRLLAFQKEFIRPYYQAVGDFIHLTTSGDDFGMQTGPFMAPARFRELIKPYFAERISFTHQWTPAHFWHHTCGSVYDLVPDLIEAGVEILNPIQPGAHKMEPERLKADFGDRLCFHGGFDTQQVLPFGSEDDIRREIARVMDAMKPGGGYIFSAAHNIQDDVPAANVVTLFREARRLGSY